MSCDHVSKVLEWGLSDTGDWTASLYGCTNCEVTSMEKLSTGIAAREHEHTEYVHGCFACKIPTLQLSPGDASSNKEVSKKKWNAELDAYANARSQGIQPAGTRMGQIERAVEASDTLGKAYDAGTMPKAESITKAHASVMKEVGL